MPGRWIDEREGRGSDWGREWRDERYDRSPETRSFDEERYDTGARFSGRDRDRVFGQRDTGAEYNRSSVASGGGMRFANQDYTRDDRFYGDDRGQPIYRGEYERGGRSRYDNAELEHRYARDMRRPASGGTGGYDFERGYGDGGRQGSYGRGSGGPSWQDRDYSGPSPAFYRQGYGGERQDHRYDGGGRFEERAYQAGQGLRRVGERISAFLGGMDRRDGPAERFDDEPRRYATDFGREPRWLGHSGRGPKNYKRADDRIQDEVCQRLTDDPWLDASQIDVGVSAGEVTLSGSVDNREAKRRAERLVEDLPGVTNVQNDLRVGGGGLRSAGRGFGDSMLEAQMKGDSLKRS